MNINKIPFNQVFTQVNKAKAIRTKKDTISLAHEVAKALEKESEELAKNQRDNSPQRFFCPT